MIAKRQKSESGAITVEATISLSTFMLLIVTILTIMNICIAQARIAYAINATAKEISQYSYLYALTGLNESQSKLAEAGKSDTLPINQVFNDLNIMYNEIENLGDSGLASASDIEDIAGKWDEIAGTVNSLKDSGTAVVSDIEAIADNPKQIIFGVAKLAGNGAMDLAKSKLITEPLARAMCKKHLVDAKGGNVESYLGGLGVVPDATGSYYRGLDFNGSALFPDGSNRIKICVSYDIKVFTLLPIDFSFHFHQTAITHGWLAGESSYKGEEEKKKQFADNNTLWTQATTQERTEYIRNLAFRQLKQEGYCTLAYPYNTDGILFRPDSKEFVMPRSWNPLSGEEGVTVDELNETVMKNYIERLCGTMNSNEFGNTVTVKKEVGGTTTKDVVDCSDAKKKIIITIPEDKGLKEKIEAVIAKSDTDGVTIELVPNYGNGAKQTEVEQEAGGTEE